MYTDDHLKQGVQSNGYDSCEQEQNYYFGSINRIDYDGQGQSDRDPRLLDDNDDSGNDSDDTHSFTIISNQMILLNPLLDMIHESEEFQPQLHLI